VKKLQTENNQIKTQVKTFENNLLQIESDQMANQMLIENIPMLQGENLPDITKKLFNYIKAPGNNSDIIEIRRLHNKIINKKPPPILIKFNSATTSKTVLEKRRSASQILTGTIDPNNNNFGMENNLTVYLNPCYPKNIRILLAEARSLKKDTPYKILYVYANKVWTKNSFVDEPLEIKNSAHIKEIQQAFETKE
jgi:hypothetical protein